MHQPYEASNSSFSYQMGTYTCTSTGNAASLSSSRHEGGNRSCTRALEPLPNCTSNDRRVGNASSRKRTDLFENITVLPKILLGTNAALSHIFFNIPIRPRVIKDSL